LHRNPCVAARAERVLVSDQETLSGESSGELTFRAADGHAILAFSCFHSG
jgi:hypothetical protein